MATRYFKRANEREVCTTSSGNRSSVQPDTPGYPYDWEEIERKEFVKLRRKIVSGRTQLAPDAGDSAASNGIANASALSTSQAESAPTQRG